MLALKLFPSWQTCYVSLQIWCPEGIRLPCGLSWGVSGLLQAPVHRLWTRFVSIRIHYCHFKISSLLYRVIGAQITLKWKCPQAMWLSADATKQLQTQSLVSHTLQLPWQLGERKWANNSLELLASGQVSHAETELCSHIKACPHHI